MNIFESIILGLVQGLTEFIPVSSSGHLIIARIALGFSKLGLGTDCALCVQDIASSGYTVGLDLAFDAVLQLATILAVFVYFRKDLFRLLMTFINWITRKPVEDKEKVLLQSIIVGTIPGVVFGLFLESYMENALRSLCVVALMLIVGSSIMWLSERKSKKVETKEPLTLKKGLIIGLFQSLALLPGISRSGATISGGLFNNLSREEATRFSFLLSFPIILGSGLKKLLDLWKEGLLSSVGPNLIVGSVVAFLVGLLAIHFLIKYLKDHTLNIFIIYRLILAIIILALI